MKRVKDILFLSSVMLLMIGCKPTVDNYKEAYDIALQKEQGDLDDEIYQKIKAQQQPKMTIVGTDSIRTKIEPLSKCSPDGSTMPVDMRFNVVVGKYKMPVNANAHCRRLNEDGFNSYLMKNSEQEYYVVAAGFEDIEEAAKFVKKIEKKYERFVGLDAPIVITPSHLMKRL